MMCLLEVCALRGRFYLTVMIPREFICCIWWFKQVIYTQQILKINKPQIYLNVIVNPAMTFPPIDRHMQERTPLLSPWILLKEENNIITGIKKEHAEFPGTRAHAACPPDRRHPPPCSVQRDRSDGSPVTSLELGLAPPPPVS